MKYKSNIQKDKYYLYSLFILVWELRNVRI